MTDNQKKKLISHIQNIISQAEAAQNKLGVSVEEQQAYRLLSETKRALKQVLICIEKIIPREPTLPQNKKKYKIPPVVNDPVRLRQIEKVHLIEEPPKPKSSSLPMCKYLSKTLDEYGTTIERKCQIRMDLDYCGDNCPYNTNIAHKIRSKPYLEKGV